MNLREGNNEKQHMYSVMCLVKFIKKTKIMHKFSIN